MISLTGMDEALKRIGVQEMEIKIKESKVKIPWDQIDEWISTVDFNGDGRDETKVIDAGDRRN